MLVEFLQIVLGVKFSSSQDYGAKIMFGGKMQPHETIIKDIFQTKKVNNVNFIIISQIKTRSVKSIKKSYIF